MISWDCMPSLSSTRPMKIYHIFHSGVLIYLATYKYKDQCMEKLDLIDSGFVKTCDELDIERSRSFIWNCGKDCFLCLQDLVKVSLWHF